MRIVDELVASGALRTPAWVEAFRAVPRGPFVPHFFERAAGGWRLVEPPDPRWQEAVESGRVLVTQIGTDDGNVEQARVGLVRGDSTSSSSQVSLMVGMLEALDVEPESRILEIGTGTGYNAALMAHGHRSVTSVDVDAAVVDRARDRLAALDLHADLVVGDGMLGCPGGAPYDRVIATVACPYVPAAWVQQCAPGATIVLPLVVGALLPKLTVLDGVAQGHFLPLLGSFMPVRAARTDVAALARLMGAADGPTRPATVPVADATHMMARSEFFAALLTGGFSTLRPGPDEAFLVTANGSWARHAAGDGLGLVSQGGPDRLWDRIEEAHRIWTDLGEPARDRFGLTVDGERHTVWLDDPASPHRWPFTPGGAAAPAR